MELCSVAGCTFESFCKTLCARHYKRAHTKSKTAGYVGELYGEGRTKAVMVRMAPALHRKLLKRASSMGGLKVSKTAELILTEALEK